jgi:hypothetical protein
MGYPNYRQNLTLFQGPISETRRSHYCNSDSLSVYAAQNAATVPDTTRFRQFCFDRRILRGHQIKEPDENMHVKEIIAGLPSLLDIASDLDREVQYCTLKRSLDYGYRTYENVKKM